MKRVLTYGTFDLIHFGHINILGKAKEHGDYLIVGLSTDSFNEQKGKKSYYSYDQREEMLNSVKYVDKVIEERDWAQKIKDIVNYNVDIFVMGDDWKGEFDYLREYCKVIYIPRTEGISTTKIKKDLLRQ